MESNSVLKTNDIVKWDCQNVLAKQVCLKLWCYQLGTKEWCYSIWHRISHVAFITHFIILDKVILEILLSRIVSLVVCERSTFFV